MAPSNLRRCECKYAVRSNSPAARAHVPCQVAEFFVSEMVEPIVHYDEIIACAVHLGEFNDQSSLH